MSKHPSTTSPETLTIALPDHFDLSCGARLLVEHESSWDQCRTCVLDFSAVREVRDSGLAWLLMFSRRAERAGMAVEFANRDPAVSARCDLAGLGLSNPTPTAAFRSVPGGSAIFGVSAH